MVCCSTPRCSRGGFDSRSGQNGNAERNDDGLLDGAKELAADARRLDVSIPWFSAAGAKESLGLIAELGIDAIADHNLALARSFASRLGAPEPASPIVRVQVDDADAAVARLRERGVACSSRSGSIRFAFHLYNDEPDVELALEALAPAKVFDAEA